MKKSLTAILLLTCAAFTLSLAQNAIEVEFFGSTANLAQATETTAFIDIHPRSCPNPFNPGKNGVFPVAILGTELLDVATIIPGSVSLMGIAPIRTAFEDVSQPAYLEQCTTAGSDGFMDLTLKFDTQQITAILGEVENGQIIPLTVSAVLLDGTTITGLDWIIIRSNSKKLSFQSYPNPFNPSTTIRYSLPEDASVQLEIFDITGRRVAEIQNGMQAEGNYSALWNGQDDSGYILPAGIYMARITAGQDVQTLRLLLLK